MRSILILAFLPALAAAQTSDTNCFINGQYVNCSTVRRAPVDTTPTDFLSGLGEVETLPNAQQEGDTPNAYAVARRRAILAKLSELIQAHRCDDAKALAIREGGLTAGQQVADLCR